MKATAPIALIFEDNPVDGKILKRYLESYGFQAHLAETPEVFFSLFQEKKPDVCFLDLNVTAFGDGFAALSVLRKKAEHKTLIFVVSGQSNTESIQKALAYGAEDYVIKPFDYSAMAIRLSRYFNTDALIGSHKSTFPFIEEPVPAKASVKVRLISIDEQFLTIQSEHLFSKNATMLLDSKVVEGFVGHASPFLMKVVDSEKNQSNLGYTVRLSFAEPEPARLSMKIRRQIL